MRQAPSQASPARYLEFNRRSVFKRGATRILPLNPGGRLAVRLCLAAPAIFWLLLFVVVPFGFVVVMSLRRSLSPSIGTNEA